MSVHFANWIPHEPLQTVALSEFGYQRDQQSLSSCHDQLIYSCSLPNINSLQTGFPMFSGPAAHQTPFATSFGPESIYEPVPANIAPPDVDWTLYPETNDDGFVVGTFEYSHGSFPESTMEMQNLFASPDSFQIPPRWTESPSNSSPSSTPSSAGSLEYAESTSHNLAAEEQLSQKKNNPPLKRKRAEVSQIQGWTKRNTTMLDSHGQPAGSMMVLRFDKPPKRSRSKEQNLNRFLGGACPQHKRVRKGCINAFPYWKCVTGRVPGVFRLSDIRFFRYGPAAGHPFETTRINPKTIFSLPDLFVASNTTIRLSQGLATEMTVSVSAFVPIEGDKTNHVWFRGDAKQVLPMPNYCLSSLGTSSDNMHTLLKFIKSSRDEYLEMIINLSGYDTSGQFTREMLRQAIEYSNSTKTSLLKPCIRLLAASRVIERDWRIVGDNTLGLTPISDPDSPWFGTIPITPIMDTSLDQMVISGYLNKQRKKILSRFEDKMLRYEPKDCFETILSIFVLSRHTELLLTHSRRNAKRYRKETRYGSLELAQEYFCAHNILLSYFNVFARTSKSASHQRGKDLIFPWSTKFSHDEGAFLRRMESLVSNQLSHASTLWGQHQYERETHWSFQMLNPKWKPEDLEIKPEITSSVLVSA